MPENIFVKVKKLHPLAKIPGYARPGDAGMDLFSVEDVVIGAGDRAIVSTGLAFEFPEGYVALIWDKSGLAGNLGIKIMGGVIEYTYRGEYRIIMLNTSKEDHIIKKGDKIAQVIFQPIVTAEVIEVGELSETNRGTNSFGSTGK